MIHVHSLILHADRKEGGRGGRGGGGERERERESLHCGCYVDERV